MNVAGHTFDEIDLIGRVLRNLQCPRGKRDVPRWVLVMAVFGVGSTVANALCCDFDLDPDEVIK